MASTSMSADLAKDHRGRPGCGKGPTTVTFFLRGLHSTMPHSTSQSPKSCRRKRLITKSDRLRALVVGTLRNSIWRTRLEKWCCCKPMSFFENGHCRVERRPLSWSLHMLLLVDRPMGSFCHSTVISSGSSSMLSKFMGYS